MKLPTQTQLLLPVLGLLAERGPMRARDVCDAVAERIGLPDEIRGVAAVTRAGGRPENLFDRQVRWTRQNAVIARLVSPDGWGIWRATATGANTYRMAKPSIVISVYQSACGSVLWAEAKAALQVVEKNSATCVLISPPYPLVKPRPYDADVPDWRPENYLHTLLDHIECIRTRLSDDGSLVLNLGPTFLPGRPVRNPYQHQLMAALVDRLAWNIVDEHFWFSPCKARGSNHVTRARTHAVNGVEQFYILSPTGRTKCNNLRVLNPYSQHHRRKLEAGGELVRAATPSQIQWPGVKHRQPHAGSIPFNHHLTPPDQDRAYRQYCRSAGVAVHPAMMPTRLAEFFILLTTEPRDLVVDCFAGSLRTAAAALRLDRRFIVSDRCLDYLRGGMCRLPADGYLPGTDVAV